jgi:hypothetical protein
LLTYKTAALSAACTNHLGAGAAHVDTQKTRKAPEGAQGAHGFAEPMLLVLANGKKAPAEPDDGTFGHKECQQQKDVAGNE